MWSNHVSDHMPKDMSWFEFLNMATDCSHDDCLFILSSTAKAKASLSISFITLAEYFYRSTSMDCFIPMQNKIGDVMLLYRWEKLRDDLVDYHSHSGQMMDSQPADSNPHPLPMWCFLSQICSLSRLQKESFRRLTTGGWLFPDLSFISIREVEQELGKRAFRWAWVARVLTTNVTHSLNRERGENSRELT